MRNSLLVLAAFLVLIGALDANLLQNIMSVLLGAAMQIIVPVLSCTPLVALAIIVGGIWYLFWRRRSA
jgi:hypothetical protein